MSALTCALRPLSSVTILRVCHFTGMQLMTSRRRRFDSDSGTYVPHDKQWIKQAVAQRLLATAVR